MTGSSDATGARWRTWRRLGAMVAVALVGLVGLPGVVAQGEEPTCDGPQNIRVTAQADGNLVAWDEWSFARAYEVWRATGGGEFEEIGGTQGDHPETPGGGHDTTFLDEDVVPGETYTYKVRAKAPPPHLSEFCGTATATAIPVFPSLLTAGLASALGVVAYAFGRRRVA